MKIFDVNITNINYEELKNKIYNSLSKNEQTLITYATADSLNKIYKDHSLIQTYAHFDIIHPDGIGVYFASRFLFGARGLKRRITGSDFYPILEEQICYNKWRIFFFGDTKQTLQKLKEKKIGKCLAGYQSGFNFVDEEVIEKINKVKPDILIIGLGVPKQEKWVEKNHSKINSKVILCVGEGIKVFAGNKKRGPIFLRSLGLEWFVRLLSNPKKFWKRYLIGIPLFLFRIIKLKFNSSQNNI